MEKFQSLADVLGVLDPQDPSKPIAPPPNPKLTRKQFCREILASREYRDSLLRRVIMDTLPPAIEALLYHYADGKPVERVEVKDTSNPLEDATAEELETRALHLAEIARRLRARRDDEDEPGPRETVN